MNLIGLIGLRRSGKDTAAQVLVEQGYENVKFAGALKAMIYSYFAYVGTAKTSADAAIEGQAKEMPLGIFGGKSTRYAMQTLGTEWGRNLIDENIWVRACLDRCRQFEKVVVSDVRFPNEVDALRNAGGKIVRVFRPGLAVDPHPSEALIASLDYDHAIHNDGSIEDFQRKIAEIVPQL